MKNQKKEGEQPKKAVTRYDQKLERRRIQAQKDARDQKIMQLSLTAVGILVLAAVAAMLVMSGINKNKAVKEIYIKVGEHEITKVEYNYFYQMTVKNYLNTYSSLLPYMGLDTNKSFADQAYTETMSWKDAFDEMTVSQITQTKAMKDDAAAKGFSPDLDEAYKEFETAMSNAAAAAGKSLAGYYKDMYGAYATKENMEAPIRESLLAEAYYNDLMEQNAPAEEDVASYYEEHKNNYDKVSYRSFTFNADLEEGASEEEIADAMALLETKARTMAERRESGADFRELCLEYAADDNKAAYEEGETDASLTERASYASIPSSYQAWLYDDSRAAGEVTVIEDESNHRYYVVEFTEKIYDDTTNSSIINTLAGEKVGEYIAALTKAYEVTDVAGELAYLRAADRTEEAVAETETVETDTTAAETEEETAEQDK